MRVGEIRQFCQLQACPPETASGRCERSRRDEGAVLTESVEVSEFDAGSDIGLCMTQLNLSARAYHRTQSVKLARTIADLAGCEEIQSVHLAEALQYRPKLMIG